MVREGGVGLGSDVSTSQLTLGRSPGRAAAPHNLEYGAVRRFRMRSEAAPGAQARAPARLDGRPTSDETFLPAFCSCVHIWQTLWPLGNWTDKFSLARSPEVSEPGSLR